MPAQRRLPVALNEASGIAPLSNSQGYALLNDSGNAASLYLTDHSLSEFAELPIPVPNVDWEALTPLAEGGYCICDIGDNRRARTQVAFHFLDEEATLTRSTVAKYSDGAHDAEACYQFDGELYVLTKAKTLRGGRRRMGYLYRLTPGVRDTAELKLVDSLQINARSVTDATLLPDSSLAFVAYNYGILGLLPYTRTSVYTVGLNSEGGFRQNTLRQRKLRSLFTLTQFEAIAPAPQPDQLLLLSERTLFVPARIRTIRIP